MVDMSSLWRNETVCFLTLFFFLDAPIAMGVWPMPQSITSSLQRYSLNPRDFHFQYASNSTAKMGCSVLDEAFKRYYPLIFPDFSAGPGDKHVYQEEKPFALVVHVDQDGCDSYPDADSSERYKLSVSSGQAALRSETVWGAVRGLETFSQLVYQDDFGAFFVNETEVEDFPRFQFRGLMLDTSRHFLPVPAILKTLDAMAYNKLNVFHWHIVDDPSFPYQSHTFPGLSNKGAFHPVTHVYTQTDLRSVVSHARLRGIRVLPEFDSPGHTQAWGKGQPGLLTPCYRGSAPSGTFGPVNPAAGSSYTFMTRLLEEVARVFPDPYLHLGGDEVDFTCWRSNPEVRTFMKKMGFGSDFTKLESFYMENIVNITSRLNRTAIVWQDVFDHHERRSAMPVVVEVWKGGCYLCQVCKVTKAGLRAILAAPWYLDQPGPTHDWGRYYTVWPLAFKGTAEQKRLVMGGEVCMWGEYVDATNISPRLWPRASAVAERLWSDEEQTASVARASPRLEQFRCRLLRRGVQAEPLFVGHCRYEYQGV